MTETVAAEEQDLRDATPPLMVRIVAGGVAVAGLMSLLTAIQAQFALYLPDDIELLCWALMGVGAATIGIAVPLGRARHWAAVAGIVITAIDALGMTWWLVASFTGGFFSCFALISAPLAAAGVIGCVLALAPAKKSTAARARMAARGESFGI